MPTSRKGRAKTRRVIKSIQKSYRRHRTTSKCRKKGRSVCRTAPGCKYASGKKRSFCRKTRNTHVRSYRKKR